jgi:pyridoxine 5-phosphate synthase
LKKSLAVNVDHVATIRQARGGAEPDPVAAAAVCELAGADGIVVHLREDRRHIQDRDVYLIKDTIKTRLNLEMGNVEEIVLIALDVKPHMVSLVPEKRQEITTEGGLDVVANAPALEPNIKRLQGAGIKVSIFIDPDLKQVKKSREIGSDFIELHTGRFCDATSEAEARKEFEVLKAAAAEAAALGLGINAGHGINYWTIKALREISEIGEFSIGHTIISRAVMVGLDRAVRDMAALINP